MPVAARSNWSWSQRQHGRWGIRIFRPTKWPLHGQAGRQTLAAHTATAPAGPKGRRPAPAPGPRRPKALPQEHRAPPSPAPLARPSATSFSRPCNYTHSYLRPPHSPGGLPRTRGRTPRAPPPHPPPDRPIHDLDRPTVANASPLPTPLPWPLRRPLFLESCRPLVVHVAVHFLLDGARSLRNSLSEVTAWDRLIVWAPCFAPLLVLFECLPEQVVLRAAECP